MYLAPSLAGLDVHLPTTPQEPRAPVHLPLRAQTTHAARRGGAAGTAGAGVVLGQTSVIQFNLPVGPTPTSPAAVADPHAARRTDSLALASRVHLTAATLEEGLISSASLEDGLGLPPLIGTPASSGRLSPAAAAPTRARRTSPRPLQPPRGSSSPAAAVTAARRTSGGRGSPEHGAMDELVADGGALVLQPPPQLGTLQPRGAASAAASPPVIPHVQVRYLAAAETGAGGAEPRRGDVGGRASPL